MVALTNCSAGASAGRDESATETSAAANVGVATARGQYQVPTTRHVASAAGNGPEGKGPGPPCHADQNRLVVCTTWVLLPPLAATHPQMMQITQVIQNSSQAAPKVTNPSMNSNTSTASMIAPPTTLE